MALQTKLKFNVHPEQLPRLRSLPLIRKISIDRAATQTLSTTYFDTKDGDLRKMGVSLRVRHVGGNILQTLKASPEAVGNAQIGYVFEAPISTERHLLSIITSPVLRKRVQEIGTENMEPLFRIDVKRTSRTVMLDDDARGLFEIEEGKIHIFENKAGRIHLGDTPIIVADVELSTSNEPLNLLYELALQVQEKIALFPTLESESDIGYRHMGMVTTAVKGWSGNAIRKRQNQERAFTAVIQECFEHLQDAANTLHEGQQPSFDTDTFATLLRLQTIIQLFSALLPKDTFDDIASEISWIVDIFRSWQNWSKLDGRLISPAAKNIGNVADTEDLRRAFDAKSKAGLSHAHDALSSARFSRLLLSLGYLLAKRPWRELSECPRGAGPSDPVKTLAANTLGGHSLRIHKLAKRAVKAGEDKNRQLVEEILKLRQAVGLFGGLYPAKRVRTLAVQLNRVEAAQAYLDSMDAARRCFSDLSNKGGTDQSIAMSAGVVLGWHLRSRKTAERKLRHSIKAFLEEKAPWRRSRR